jgi:hypothetical protein
MLPSVRQRPLKPNWWTIVPVLASLLLWGGIMYVGALTGPTLSDRSERVAAITAPEEVSALTH